MSYNFNSTHVETIIKLHELVNKHSATFTFGFDSGTIDTIDEELEEQLLQSQVIAIGDEYKVSGSYEKIYFELKYKNKFYLLVYGYAQTILIGDGVVDEYSRRGHYEHNVDILRSDFDLQNDEVELKYPYRNDIVLGCFAHHVAYLLGEKDYFKGIVY